MEFYLIGVDNYLPFVDAMNSLMSWDFKDASEKFEEPANTTKEKLARIGELSGAPEPPTRGHPNVNYAKFFEGHYHLVLGLAAGRSTLSVVEWKEWRGGGFMFWC